MGEDKVSKNVIERALGRMLYKKLDNEEYEEHEKPERDNGKDCRGGKY